jgi:hypothetical protein
MAPALSPERVHVSPPSFRRTMAFLLLRQVCDPAQGEPQAVAYTLWSKCH